MNTVGDSPLSPSKSPVRRAQTWEKRKAAPTSDNRIDKDALYVDIDTRRDDEDGKDRTSDAIRRRNSTS